MSEITAPASASAGASKLASEIDPEVRAGLRVLIIEDDRTLREGCRSVLAHDGYNVTATGNGDEAMKLVQSRKWDVVLCDLYMTPVTGMDILQAALAYHPDTLFVIMTGNPSVSSSLEALRAGAWDYIPKPFNASHLQIMLGRAANATVVGRATRRLRSDAGPVDTDPEFVLLGESKPFRKLMELVRRVAMTDASVMITGESGTGKEMVAQFLHRHSRRASRPMVPVNCAALPEPLLESELFGHKRGAFTGADRDKPGLIEIANGGTFFLDELTEAPLSIQAKLLRVIQDGVVRRVGSETQDAIVDVRFVSATNRDPVEAVARQQLREDLFFRLRVVPVTLPPLRERPEDIPILARHFLAQYWTRHRNPEDPAPVLGDSTLDFLCSLAWRGNVRELQNAMEHLAVLAEPGATLAPEDLPVDHQARPARTSGSVFPPEFLRLDFHAAKDAVIAQFEKAYLNHLVTSSNANMSKAARAARIDRTTLYRLMDKHGMRRELNAGLEGEGEE
ncbi:MAG: sigma-54 dependent transcriptional regulator [Gemmatimonadaceae bacterium]|nr:sigma-54 dependent transcriptional regulator [Gemmatimonadaceae bacterium]